MSAGGALHWLGLLSVPMLLAGAPIRAEEPPPTEASAEAESSSEEPRETGNPCRIPGQPGDPVLDRMRRGVFETVCGTARWFDRFFGDRRFDNEVRRTHGRVGLQVVGDEEDGVDLNTRFHANVELPNVEHRLNVFLGRETEQDYVSGRDEGFELLPDFFREANDEEWLLGLGYRPAGGARQRLDFDAGIELRTPLEPFVRGGYRRYWVLEDRYLLRFKETLFWRNQRGFGASTAVDVEQSLGPERLLRLANLATIEQYSEGVRWRSSLTLFDVLGRQRAIAYLLAVEGETDAEVPIREWGLRVTYRQRMFREWFFGELLGGVTWPRERLGDPRKAAFHIGIGFELQFEGGDD